ncbi:MAG: hypothetical protein J7J87_00345 [Candidatus Diapherotrites archaeon]|nr:hypothetical protein [Candidatus Diapherotrites archaeon]
MNQKAFNLFTALLAFILILTSTILFLTMIQTETNTSHLIDHMASQARLESVARLVRADIFQTFNQNLREVIEDYFRHNEVIIGDLKAWEDWDQLKEEFSEGYFVGNEKFAREIAKALPGLELDYAIPYEGKYKVEMYNDDRERFREVLQSAIDASASSGDFIEVVECDGTPENCPLGTFYINLKITELSDEEYESLPMLRVTDLLNGSYIADPIIPRNDIKLYVPLRLFKAMAITRKMMHSDLAYMNTRYDFGYLSPRIHNEFDSMALGYCDYGFCYPRENPYFPPDKRYSDDKACSGTGVSNSLTEITGNFRGMNFTYNLVDRLSTNYMVRKLAELAKKRLCELSKENISSYDSPGDFEIEKDPAEPNCYVIVEAGDIRASAKPSKLIKTGSERKVSLIGTNPKTEPNQTLSSCPFNFTLGQNRRIGYYKGPGGIMWPDSSIGSEICNGFESMSALLGMIPPKCGYGTSWACCTEITEMNFKVSFIEKNPEYKINKDLETRFAFKIVDRSFTGFNPNYDSGATDIDCALAHAPQSNTCVASAWTCMVKPAGGYQGCYPEFP